MKEKFNSEFVCSHANGTKKKMSWTILAALGVATLVFLLIVWWCSREAKVDAEVEHDRLVKLHAKRMQKQQQQQATRERQTRTNSALPLGTSKNPETITFSVKRKSKAHPMYQQGSPMGFVVHTFEQGGGVGAEGGTLKLVRGKYYRFKLLCGSAGDKYDLYFTEGKTGGMDAQSPRIANSPHPFDYDLTVQMPALKDTKFPERFYYHSSVHLCMGGPVELVADE